MIKNISKYFSQHDLTSGNPTKGIIQFSIPLLIGNIAQQLYNTADSIIVSHYIDDNALGAVGACNPILNMLIILYVAVATGAGVLIGQYYGAKNKDKLSQSIGTSITLTLLTSIVITIMGVMFTAPILRLLNTPPEIYDMAVMYLKTIFYGVAGLAMYNMLTAVLRAIGDSFSPLLYLIVASILNIILDIVFVSYLGMSTNGVAIATVISQTFSAILCYLKLRSMKNIFTLDSSSFNLNIPMSKKIMSLGMPNGITQGVFSTSMLIVQSLTNSMGAIVVTASTVVMRIDGFVMMPNFTFGIASTTFTAQNVGARNIERVKKGATSALNLGLACSFVLAMILIIWGRPIATIFTTTSEIVIMAGTYIRILALGYILFSVTQVLSGVMRGAGDTVTPMWISVIVVLFIRLPLAYLLSYLSRSAIYPNGDPKSLFYSLLGAWVIGGLLTYFAYKNGKWHKKINFIENNNNVI